MASSVFTITVLLVFAVVLVLALPVVHRRMRTYQETIAAEIWADDILEEPAEIQQGKVSSVAREKPVYRWGRITIFGISSLNFIFALLTGILVPFTSISWGIPTALLAISFIGLGLLRYLAIQDKKKVVLEKPKKNESHESVSQIVLKPQEKAQKKEIFASVSGAVQVKPIKHRQQKPINYASKSLRYVRTHHQPARQEHVKFQKLPSGKIQLEEQLAFEAEGTWDVRETPRPTYLDAEVKYRDEVPALELREDVAAESITIQDAAQRAHQLDLDNILLRRRA